MRRDTTERQVIFKAFFKEYYAPFCIFAKRFIADEETRRDIVTEAFTKLWVNTDFELDKKSVLTFLKICVRNDCLNHLKHQIHIDDYSKHAAEHVPVYAESPESLYTLDEMYALLYKTIEELPEKEKKIFMDSFLNEKKQKEIAEEMNISTKTVARCQKEIISKLRVELKDFHSLLAVLTILVAGNF